MTVVEGTKPTLTLPFPFDLGGIIRGKPTVAANDPTRNGDEPITKETWQALVRWTMVILAILIVVLALEKLPRIGAPLLIILVLGMLLTATNKGLI